MGLPLYIVDAFAERPFGGNPAAVCLLEEPMKEAWMRQVAGEMNLSETAFVLREGRNWRLRWFTPKCEVNLCGHATLASTHVLWERGIVGHDRPAEFETLSGRMVCGVTGEGIEMAFPAEPAEMGRACEDVQEALRVTRVVAAGRNRNDLLVELENEEQVRTLEPDLAKVARLAAEGIIVTARSAGGRFDFVSRFFAPRLGIAEDPVTGSAHCCLGPYWQDKLGKREMIGYQASARGGVVRMQVRGDRVTLGGQAVTVMRGELAV